MGNMLSTIIILLVAGITSAQINGEFWWLNDKLAQIKGANQAPQFEEVSEFDTDESDKVVFNDENSADDFNGDVARNNDKWNIRFQDHTQLTWPNEHESKSTVVPSSSKKPNAINEDVLEFKFPDSDKLVWKDIKNTSRHTLPAANISDINGTKNKTVLITDKVIFKVYKEETTQVQNICTFLKKSECNSRNGLVYIKRDRYHPKKTPTESQFICCILPLPSDKSSKVHFADDFPIKRFKRSGKSGDISTALKQRNALMHRKFPIPNRKVKTPVSPEPAKVTHKIVAPDDDYVDPYANIKNSNFKKSYVPTDSPYEATGTKYEYDTQDYVEDYVVELPRPGLVGLYSDHAPGSGWTYVSSGKPDSPYSTVDDAYDDVDDDAPGYSTFDPRLVDRIAMGTAKPPKRRPIFTTENSDEISYDAQSHTVNYQAHPDFHILQGFKLLNLIRNTSRIYSKNGRRTTTTERVADSSECVQTRPIMINSDEDSEYDDVFDVNESVFGDCGKAVKDPLKECEHDKQIGEADVGSHPWLALAVLTKSPQSILCYASLVHPRAAVTAADCIYGRTTPGEVTLLAGVWDLEDDSSMQSQQRMAQIHVDQQYKPGNLAHNLAMLHWKRPLKLGVNVQPACVADPHVGDTCKFVGWGGYDQAIRERPRWQRAEILTPRQCNERLSSTKRRVTLPPDTFCASIESRASVTGVGGPLTCNVGGRHSVVGVAVWRDSALVLLPAHEWTLRTAAALRIR